MLSACTRHFVEKFGSQAGSADHGGGSNRRQYFKSYPLAKGHSLEGVFSRIRVTGVQQALRLLVHRTLWSLKATWIDIVRRRTHVYRSVADDSLSSLGRDQVNFDPFGLATRMSRVLTCLWFTSTVYRSFASRAANIPIFSAIRVIEKVSRICSQPKGYVLPTSLTLFMPMSECLTITSRKPLEALRGRVVVEKRLRIDVRPPRTRCRRLTDSQFISL